jgi:hypothetical protein
MGQDPGQVGAPVEQAQSPEELRRDIDQTRRDLGDTAAALAEKTDVKARMKDKVEGVKQTVAEKTSSDAGSGSKASSLLTTAKTKARENPVASSAGAAFLGGFLLGRLRSR